MEHVVVGLTDEATARVGVTWAMGRARTRPLAIRLVAELDDGGSNPGAAKEVLATATRQIAEALPGTEVDYVLADRPLLHELLEQSESADLIVFAAHPDPVMREGRTPSFQVSLGARARCPVVVVPSDWEEHGGPIVVGVESENASDKAVAFAAGEALAGDRELRIVHSWEPWTSLTTRSAQVEHGDIINVAADRIRADFPGVRLSAVLAEAVAHDGIIANSRDAHLIVLGTHGLGRETGLVLGAIHQEVMIRGSVPLCIVPLESA
ncbi:MAG: universal stress protein [Pseudolysinimonas sp.]